MSIENILITVFIAVATNVLLNFKGFCENVDYLRHRLGHDDEMTGRWGTEYNVNGKEMGLTGTGWNLVLDVRFGRASGYFQRGAQCVLCRGRFGVFSRTSVFYTVTFRDGCTHLMGEFTVRRGVDGVLIIDGLEIDGKKKRLVLAKYDDSVIS